MCPSYQGNTVLVYGRLLFGTPDALSALGPVLQYTAQLNVRNPLTRMAQQHHHEHLFQHSSRCSCSSDEALLSAP